jgi:hypothetical protein
MIRFLLFFLIASCAHTEARDSTDSDLIQTLHFKRELYINLQTEIRPDSSWILTEHCDALLHTALLVAGGSGTYDDLFDARDNDGRWYRRPTKDCLGNGSKSSISRDMLLGLMVAIWHEKDLAAIKELIIYGEEHDWIYGEHDGSLDGKSRVYANPSFQALMYTLRHALGGEYHVKQEIPQDYTPFKSGFTKHLTALIIHLMGEMNSELSKIEYNTIKSFAEADPNNALFWAIFKKYDDGDQSIAAEILLREDLFPSERLPTTLERCHPYLWMHGEPGNNDDWDPCPPQRIHPGHDFLFASSLILL